MRQFKNIMVTGGAGFIGVNFIRYLLNKTPFKGNIYNYDALTYAGNPLSLQDIAAGYKGRYHFCKGDICDEKFVKKTIAKNNIDCIVHFAAESHVDRSIHGPAAFIKTNVNGTFILLEAVREAAEKGRKILFHHVSTDEVFGSLGSSGFFYEDTAYDPRSPYAASKAASDHIVRSYHHTYNLPLTISNCSNNYGPYQFPEKLIPLMIINALEGKELPVYGAGKNIRDWLHVNDHSAAVWQIITRGRTGTSYNIGGENEWQNIELVKLLCKTLAARTGEAEKKYTSLIKFVKDRKGHDFRYAINCDKIKNELGWQQEYTFARGLEQTVAWYMDNREWTDTVRTGAYREWIKKNYQ
ncbi:MAG TPA: dTDP-glucose 4,6-dehydratase [Spirochaetota bacterium]|nr:dTDP-glucose 4,6-dehydratase [Spirochaetota bacterium]